MPESIEEYFEQLHEQPLYSKELRSEYLRSYFHTRIELQPLESTDEISIETASNEGNESYKELECIVLTTLTEEMTSKRQEQRPIEAI